MYICEIKRGWALEAFTLLRFKCIFWKIPHFWDSSPFNRIGFVFEQPLSMRGKGLSTYFLTLILSWKANCRTLFNYMQAHCKQNSERGTLLSYFSHFSIGKIPSLVFFTAMDAANNHHQKANLHKWRMSKKTCSDKSGKGQRWNFSLWAFFSHHHRWATEKREVFSARKLSVHARKGFDIVKNCMLNYSRTIN